jgi:iron(III) transport system substrate-binding protein
MEISRRRALTFLSAGSGLAVLVACGRREDSPNGTAAERRVATVYSGRSENLVGPLMQVVLDRTGLDVAVRYGSTSEMAATILEEGLNSPADLFFAQDAGALGALAREGLLAPLPSRILSRVPDRFRSPAGEWVGLSGRARVVVYNTDLLKEGDLPDSILGFTDERWLGRLGWAPSNGSFQAFVTGLRVQLGEEAAREWLEGILANAPAVFPKNTPIVEAVITGEIDAGFVNHYYLMRQLAERPDVPAANYFFTDGDPGALVNVAGVGILQTSKHKEASIELIEFLLSDETQRYFADATFEYPLVDGVAAHAGLPSLAEIETPSIDLSDLEDLRGTLDLLQDVGAL